MSPVKVALEQNIATESMTHKGRQKLLRCLHIASPSKFLERNDKFGSRVEQCLKRAETC